MLDLYGGYNILFENTERCKNIGGQETHSMGPKTPLHVLKCRILQRWTFKRDTFGYSALVDVGQWDGSKNTNKPIWNQKLRVGFYGAYLVTGTHYTWDYALWIRKNVYLWGAWRRRITRTKQNSVFSFTLDSLFWWRNIAAEARSLSQVYLLFIWLEREAEPADGWSYMILCFIFDYSTYVRQWEDTYKKRLPDHSRKFGSGEFRTWSTPQKHKDKVGGEKEALTERSLVIMDVSVRSDLLII